MYLYTLATHNYGYYNALEKSAKNNNFKLINLGKNMKWKGLMWKFEMMLKALNNHNDNMIVAFCDGFDVIVCNDSSKLQKAFIDLNCDIIFGNENSNHNYIIHLLSYLSFKNYHMMERNNTPNTGVYVGYVGKLKKFISLCLKLSSIEDDDQDIGYLIFANMKKYNLNIKIVNEYIHTIPFYHNTLGLLNLQEIIINKITTDINKVFFIHANGNRNMNIYCEILNLPLKNTTTKTNHNHILHYTKKILKNNYKLFLFIILYYLKKR